MDLAARPLRTGGRSPEYRLAPISANIANGGSFDGGPSSPVSTDLLLRDLEQPPRSFGSVTSMGRAQLEGSPQRLSPLNRGEDVFSLKDELAQAMAIQKDRMGQCSMSIFDKNMSLLSHRSEEGSMRSSFGDPTGVPEPSANIAHAIPKPKPDLLGAKFLRIFMVEAEPSVVDAEATVVECDQGCVILRARGKGQLAKNADTNMLRKTMSGVQILLLDSRKAIISEMFHTVVERVEKHAVPSNDVSRKEDLHVLMTSFSHQCYVKVAYEVRAGSSDGKDYAIRANVQILDQPSECQGNHDLLIHAAMKQRSKSIVANPANARPSPLRRNGMGDGVSRLSPSDIMETPSGSESKDEQLPSSSSSLLTKFEQRSMSTADRIFAHSLVAISPGYADVLNGAIPKKITKTRYLTLDASLLEGSASSSKPIVAAPVKARSKSSSQGYLVPKERTLPSLQFAPQKEKSLSEYTPKSKGRYRPESLQVLRDTWRVHKWKQVAARLDMGAKSTRGHIFWNGANSDTISSGLLFVADGMPTMVLDENTIRHTVLEFR